MEYEEASVAGVRSHSSPMWSVAEWLQRLERIVAFQSLVYLFRFWTIMIYSQKVILQLRYGDSNDMT
jgi:hypothetical protein